MDPTPSRIVLAEDNPADVGLVREALHEHDVLCELRVLSDGEAALAFIDRLESETEIPCPDLLLLDMHLPRHDGGEILRYFRASRRCGQTPVVILTSVERPWDHQQAENAAPVRYFQKPISLTQFLQLGRLVKEVIGRGR